ncbi:MAG TPA: von Willebrand factor type A domain-containing protein, partial [Alphaproteobacteria bacterium]|nr:von Willebrand factor type A domain-containing protein [Alphaproteobacteria bacterium]
MSTALVLFGCNSEQIAQPTANSNQPRNETKAKTEELDAAAQGATVATPLAQADTLQGGAYAPPAASAPQIEITQAPILPGEGESYAAIDDYPVKQVVEAPVSTFSIDVDTGAYANVRRFLLNGQLPPRDAVRVEEMINYFGYDYPGPADDATPFRVTTAVERTPWNSETYLLHVGIKGYAPPRGERPPANLVFLVDVSGSMADADKLPLLKSGMKLLADQLRDDDTVSIVVYAGAAGLV